MSALLLSLCIVIEPPPGEIESGPKVGDKASKLDAFAVVGEIEDKRLDLAKSRTGRRTIFVFVNSERWDRPAARFLKKLDEAVEEAKDRSAVVAIWISGDVEKSKEYLPIAQHSLKFEHTALAVAADPVVSPPDWEINSNASLTVVVVKDGIVSAAFGFTSTNETDAKKVVAAWKKLDAKPKQEAKKPAAEKPPTPSR